MPIIRELEATETLNGPLWLGLRTAAYLRLFHADGSALGRQNQSGSRNEVSSAYWRGYELGVGW